ncbi:tetratricopeptide repeat protein [Evansella tamaricis]|uniref:Peptidase MA-like domain-containing protein n=1 Tax=Evansella tamaricis TaxID=2069301 RepID=A0ABS6JLM4_9BACI|nr:hypothetical protein [Evansella tamaricis]MBU9713213.1 hypothetical protein [Evansella tamaricis]
MKRTITVLSLTILIIVVFFVNKISDNSPDAILPNSDSSQIRGEALNLLLSFKHDDYLKIDGKFYTIWYHPDDEQSLEIVVEQTGYLLNQGESWFGDMDLKAHHLDIFLINKNDQPHPLLDQSGSYDVNANIIVIQADLEKEELLNVFSHEFAHFLTITYSGLIGLDYNELPLWFHEGTADSFAHRLSPLPYHRKFAFHDIVPLEEITEVNFEMFDQYTLSYFAVEKLLQEYGEDIIRKLIDETKSAGDFKTAFHKNTNYNLSDYHLLFEVSEEELIDIQQLVEQGFLNEAEEKIEDILEVRGEYFYNAPYLFRILSDIYLEQENYEKALAAKEKQLLYAADPILYMQLTKIALYVNNELAVGYGEKALEIAKIEDWDVEYFEEWFDEIKGLTKN